jgi:hypothetical protein
MVRDDAVVEGLEHPGGAFEHLVEGKLARDADAFLDGDAGLHGTGVAWLA